MKKRNIGIRNKKGLILESDKIVSLVKFTTDSEGKNQIEYYATAIGSVDNNSFTDKLSIPIKIYKLYENPFDAKKALKKGELKVDEPYCCSYYDYNNIFPELSSKTTKEEAILYLKEKNETGINSFAWTFLDDEEKKKINVKMNQMRKNY